MEQAVRHVLTYFAHFSYAPSFEDIYLFFPLKTTKKNLKHVLDALIERKLLITKVIQLPHNIPFKIKNCRIYALPPYGIFIGKRTFKTIQSIRKIQKSLFFLKIVSLLPQVRLIGISGGLSMLHSGKRDDIDIFVIAQKGRLWTMRLILLLLAQLSGVRRRRTEKNPCDKVCFNLFFDEEYLEIPLHKRNEYVAHEILQMKPIVVKGEIYTRFLQENRWVFDFFPNARTILARMRQRKKKHLNISNKYETITHALFSPFEKWGDFVEFLCKKFERFLIEKHRTTEIITDTQLWFFPHDVEEELKKKNLID